MTTNNNKKHWLIIALFAMLLLITLNFLLVFIFSKHIPLESENNNFRTEINTLQEELKVKEQEIKKLEKLYHGSSEQLKLIKKRLQSELENLRNDLNSISNQDNWDRNRNDILDKFAQIEASIEAPELISQIIPPRPPSKKTAKTIAELEEKDKEIRRLQIKNESLGRKLNRQKTRIFDLEKKLAEATTDINQITNLAEIEKLSKRIAELEDTLAAAKTQKAEQERQQQQTIAQKDRIINRQDSIIKVLNEAISNGKAIPDSSKLQLKDFELKLNDYQNFFAQEKDKLIQAHLINKSNVSIQISSKTPIPRGKYNGLALNITLPGNSRELITTIEGLTKKINPITLTIKIIKDRKYKKIDIASAEIKKTFSATILPKGEYFLKITNKSGTQIEHTIKFKIK